MNNKPTKQKPDVFICNGRRFKSDSAVQAYCESNGLRITNSSITGFAPKSKCYTHKYEAVSVTSLKTTNA